MTRRDPFANVAFLPPRRGQQEHEPAPDQADVLVGVVLGTDASLDALGLADAKAALPPDQADALLAAILGAELDLGDGDLADARAALARFVAAVPTRAPPAAKGTPSDPFADVEFLLPRRVQEEHARQVVALRAELAAIIEALPTRHPQEETDDGLA